MDTKQHRSSTTRPILHGPPFFPCFFWLFWSVIAPNTSPSLELFGFVFGCFFKTNFWCIFPTLVKLHTFGKLLDFFHATKNVAMSFSKSSVCHHSGNARICEKMYCSYCSDLESSFFFLILFWGIIQLPQKTPQKTKTKWRSKSGFININYPFWGIFFWGISVILGILFIWSRFYPYNSSTSTWLCWYQVKLPALRNKGLRPRPR